MEMLYSWIINNICDIPFLVGVISGTIVGVSVTSFYSTGMFAWGRDEVR